MITLFGILFYITVFIFLFSLLFLLIANHIYDLHHAQNEQPDISFVETAKRVYTGLKRLASKR